MRQGATEWEVMDDLVSNFQVDRLPSNLVPPLHFTRSITCSLVESVSPVMDCDVVDCLTNKLTDLNAVSTDNSVNLIYKSAKKRICNEIVL